MMKIFRRVMHKINRFSKKAVRLWGARKIGLIYEKPNFLYIPRLTPDSVVIDAGCSYEADFSRMMIERYGVKAYAIDPTMKHRHALEKFEKENSNHFIFLPFAISAEDGVLTFHESRTNESGSLMNDHKNVRDDEIISYEVRAMTLNSLLKHIGVANVDILKLDVEGAEYRLLDRVDRADLTPFKQIFIEFHHHAVPRYSEADTKRIVDRICSFGFNKFSLDDHNYLLWQNK
ncbi:MAG: FkbM family methyltransferase [Sphingomonadales bacterium]|nr:FkbM family methyltransferase [Sphingomonadales bacterium]